MMIAAICKRVYSRAENAFMEVFVPIIVLAVLMFIMNGEGDE